MEIEHAVAAGNAVCEVSFNALIVAKLSIATLIMRKPTIRKLIIARLIDHASISSIFIIATPVGQVLLGAALTVVTLARLRSRTGSSIPVVFNLSIAQVLRLFSHWSHISLI
jgi:hypothetical protein